MRINSYVADILRSVEGSKEEKNDFSSREQMSIRLIKDESADLDEVCNLLSEFNSNIHPMLKINSTENKRFLEDLPKEKKAEFSDMLMKFKLVQSEMMEIGLVNERIMSLAHHLAALKVQMIAKNHRETRLLLKKFFSDKDVKLAKVMDDIKRYDSKVKELKDNHEMMINFCHMHIDDLEEKLMLEHGASGQIKDMEKISMKQKKLVSSIGKHVSSITREILKDKELKGFIEEKKIF